jgi:hypothetical protein
MYSVPGIFRLRGWVVAAKKVESVTAAQILFAAVAFLETDCYYLLSELIAALLNL